MVYLIGKTLKHSKSKRIHGLFSNLKYDYLELASIDELQNYRYMGLNVTIPYKQEIIPLLDEIDPKAKEIGAVNTVVVKNGKKIGYNTDYDGFRALLKRYDVTVDGRSCLILGTGGSSKTVATVLTDLGATKIDYASRSNGIRYEDLKDVYQIIVNTTPVGMYPNNDSPIQIENFNTEAVIDIVYNPLRTKLLMNNTSKSVPGLYMLVYQAFRAHELFLGESLDPLKVEEVFQKLLKELSNIVFIGMPMSGKTTRAKRMARKWGKAKVDTDDLIEATAGQSIPELFAQGEHVFRDMEHQIVEMLALRQGMVIATGGGIIENEENINLLKQNGVIVYLRRTLSYLQKRNPKDRPLLQDKNFLEELFIRRDPLYTKYADINTTASDMEESIDEYFSVKRG